MVCSPSDLIGPSSCLGGTTIPHVEWRLPRWRCPLANPGLACHRRVRNRDGSIRDACMTGTESGKEGAMQQDTLEDTLSAFASEEATGDTDARISAAPRLF